MPRRELPATFLVAFSLAGEQRDLVRSIAEAVEAELGFGTVFLDEWFEYYIAGHDADLRLQEIYGQRCSLAVVCVSGNYGSKPWTQAEHEAIRARLMKARTSENKGERHTILPIRVGPGEVDGIPSNAIVPDARAMPAAKTADLIIERLRLIVPDLKRGASPQAAGLSWPETPPMLRWPVADHTAARQAFEQLLTHKAPWRYLPLRGSSETGKSHIGRQMHANALQIANLACGRFDFKGTTGMDAEVRAFVPDLGVPLPPDGPRLNERLGQILDVLKRNARPTLLIFDTYEAAGEGQDWVEKQLLPSLIRGTWLRVVIAGQRVPEGSGAVWELVARSPLQLALPTPEEWLQFGQLHKPSLTLDFVEKAYKYCDGRASTLAQLLGPAT